MQLNHNKMKKQIVLITLVFIILSLAGISALVVDSVNMNPDEIAPGETSKVNLGLENNGNLDVNDVNVILDLSAVPFAPYDSSSEFNIDEIRDGRIKYAEFEIIALSDAKSGIYKIPVKVSYEEDNEIKTKNLLISININSKPVIGISSENALLLKGQENEVSIKIINKGLNDVKFLEIGVGGSTSYDILSEKNVYVGDVDSDDFEEESFNIYFKPNSLSRVNLPVSLRYKDSLNKEYTEELTIPLTIYSKEKAIEAGLLQKSNTSTYITIVVVIIIIYIIYRKIKKSRKRKKEQKENALWEYLNIFV